MESRAVPSFVHVNRSRRLILLATLAAVAATGLLCLPSGSANAQVFKTEALPDGVQRTTYRVGPINVTSGQNRIVMRPMGGSEKPPVDGWITRIKPDLTNEDGTVPKSSRVMFHHGVWINGSRGQELFYATGEEKTILDLPHGYGYRYKQSDVWILNHMIHNLVPDPMKLYITYTVDFIPATNPSAAGITEAKPIWMDVENGSIYPVFDVHRGSGGADGEFTYPQDDPDAYPNGFQKNERTITRDGVLISTTGHVHTGGLSTNLYLRRTGASYQGEICEPAADFSGEIKRLARKQSKLTRRVRTLKKQGRTISKRLKKARRIAKSGGRTNRLSKQRKKNRKKLAGVNRQKKSNGKHLRKAKGKQKSADAAHTRCVDSQPQVEGNRVHLFNSKAKYFDPRGPVSWDMAMYTTDDDWKVQVKAGDKLELQTTYETERASWYESMGINVVYMAEEAGGRNPYETKVDTEGVLNHGHYPENEDYGGENPTVGPDPATLPDGLASGGPFTIGGYTYSAGGFNLPGANGRPPVVRKGESFTFQMSNSDNENQIWHSLTSCKAPCNKSTGISYPIPDGEFQFDSGQLGKPTHGYVEPTVNRTTWSTPKDLPVGTHTFFCRIHPLMRGAVRVKP